MCKYHSEGRAVYCDRYKFDYAQGITDLQPHAPLGAIRINDDDDHRLTAPFLSLYESVFWTSHILLAINASAV